MRMPKITLDAVPLREGSGYPSPHDEPCRARTTRSVGAAGGLTQFGVNLLRLSPGAWSSQRHWHAREDELIYVVSGTLILVEDGGETELNAGDFAAFAAGVQDGHHLQNRSDADATFIAVGTRDDADSGTYSDIDMRFKAGRYTGTKSDIFVHKDGRPYKT